MLSVVLKFLLILLYLGHLITHTFKSQKSYNFSWENKTQQAIFFAKN